MNILKATQKGFTLIEIMIVVAIIGIIASIAVPSYTDYIEQARATEATATLADLRIKMEQCFQDERDYSHANCAAFCAPANAAQYFNFSCTPAATATTYTLAAAGTGSMAGFSFNVNESNDKNSVFHGTTGNGCWLTSKSGSC